MSDAHAPGAFRHFDDERTMRETSRANPRRPVNGGERLRRCAGTTATDFPGSALQPYRSIESTSPESASFFRPFTLERFNMPSILSPRARHHSTSPICMDIDSRPASYRFHRIRREEESSTHLIPWDSSESSSSGTASVSSPLSAFFGFFIL